MSLAISLGIIFLLSPLDCEPFYHGYGPSCADKRLVIAIWELPVTDVYGQKGKIPFYITDGNGPILLENNVISKSDLLGNDQMLVIKANTLEEGSPKLCLPTFSAGEAHSLRTYLHVVPENSKQFSSFFMSTSLLGEIDKKDDSSKFSDQRYARQFAVRLHTFTHFSPKDMKQLCRRAGILTPTLSQSLDSVYEDCTTCKSSGRPLQSRKVSFNGVMADFN